METPGAGPAETPAVKVTVCKAALFVCEICDAESKYTCPGCGAKTCSLACVRAHKDKDGCTGKRARSEMVVKRSSMNDSTIINDYQLMEDGSRFVGAANRGFQADNKRRKGQLSNHQKRMQKAATAQGITLKMLPTLFERRKANQTTITQKNKIMWTLEWVFEEAEAKWIEKGHADSEAIYKHLQNFLAVRSSNVARRHRLKHYLKAGSDECRHLRVFMVAEGRPANEKGYYEVDLDQTLTDLLSGKIVIEFPTFYVKTEESAAGIKVFPHPPKPPPPPIPEPGTAGAGGGGGGGGGGNKGKGSRKRKGGGGGGAAAGSADTASVNVSGEAETTTDGNAGAAVTTNIDGSTGVSAGAATSGNGGGTLTMPVVAPFAPIAETSESPVKKIGGTVGGRSGGGGGGASGGGPSPSLKPSSTLLQPPPALKASTLSAVPMRPQTNWQ